MEITIPNILILIFGGLMILVSVYFLVNLWAESANVKLSKKGMLVLGAAFIILMTSQFFKR